MRMRSVWVLYGLGWFMLLAAWRTPAAGGSPVPAVWREQHVKFHYMGRTSRYSCDGLRDKVRALLLDLGARQDLQVVASGCADYGRVVAAFIKPRLDVVFSAPALPDGGIKSVHDRDLAATDARFVPFMITSDAFRNMGVGDCELVQEFSHQILPKLTTRALQQDIACGPDQQGGTRFYVKGEILKSLPSGEQSLRH